MNVVLALAVGPLTEVLIGAGLIGGILLIAGVARYVNARKAAREASERRQPEGAGD